MYYDLLLFLVSPIMFVIAVGILGLFFGSFANVVVHRIKHGGSIWIDRSKCPKCEHTLGFFDLVPVFSWVFLGRKCRYCSEKISWQYPLVELVFGLFWAFVAYMLSMPHGMQEWLYFVFVIFLVSSLIVVTVYDLLHYEIPDEVSFPLIAFSLFALALPQSPQILSALVALVMVYSFFYLQILIPAVGYALEKKKFSIILKTLGAYFVFPVWLLLSSFLPQKWVEKLPGMKDDEEMDEVPSWIGGGDLRLAFVMGLVLGVQKSVVALFVAYFAGAIVGVLVMLVQKKDRKSVIPFGPYLALGTMVALFYGEQLWQWYWALLAF